MKEAIDNLTFENRIAGKFPSFERELVAQIAENARTQTFQEGDQLMKPGQYIRSTMLLMNGLIKIFREDDEGNEFFMYYLQPGQACALSMICATRQETSQIMAKAVAQTEILSVPISYMDIWMLTYKSWYYFVLDTYRSRFEEVLLTVDHIAFRNMDERLLYYLQRQQETLKTNILQISITEIASELNSSREVISRLLKKLVEKKNILVHKNRLEIVDLQIH